jgi:O-antigen/teichoic acid export membrane protein
MVVLGLCLPPMYLNIMLAQILVAAKRQSSWTWVMVVATIVNPLFNLALIPFTEHRYGNGAIGAAVALLLTEIVLVTCGFVIVGRRVFDRATLRRCLLAAAAAAAMWAVSYAARPLGIVVSVAAGLAAFAVLVVVLRIATAEEIAAVRGQLGRLRRR